MTKPLLAGLFLPYNKLDKQICERFLKKRVLILPVIFVGTPNMITEIVPRKVILNPRMFDKT